MKIDKMKIETDALRCNNVVKEIEIDGKLEKINFFIFVNFY